MLGFGLCLWQHNVGSQIPPYVCCRTVQRMGSTSVIAHLAGQPGAEVTVTLEIDARLLGGASEQTVRTVAENCRTLTFESHGFESE